MSQLSSMGETQLKLTHFDALNDSRRGSKRTHQLRDEMKAKVLKELLGHGFHETKQGVRYTISEAARPAKVLARLLKLNHERYADEVKQGLHEKKGRGARGKGREKAKAKKGKAETGPSLFEEEGDA